MQHKNTQRTPWKYSTINDHLRLPIWIYLLNFKFQKMSLTYFFEKCRWYFESNSIHYCQPNTDSGEYFCINRCRCLSSFDQLKKTAIIQIYSCLLNQFYWSKCTIVPQLLNMWYMNQKNISLMNCRYRYQVYTYIAVPSWKI